MSEKKEIDLNTDSLDFDDFDLADIEEDDPLAEMDLSAFGDISEVVDYPHIKVSTKSFKDFLRVARAISSNGGRDIVAKAVCLTADGDKLICRATDFDVYIEERLELLNVDKVLLTPVVVPTDVLIKLSRATPINTIIYQKADGPKGEISTYLRLYGGDIVLESYVVDVKKFAFVDPVSKVGDISSDNLSKVISDFSPLVTSAVSPAERRILCEGDKAYANYMWAILIASKPFAKMDLKIKDINVLRSIVFNGNENIAVYRTDTEVYTVRVVLEGSNFKYAFLVSEIALAEAMKQNIGEVVKPDGVFVDFLQLYKMIEVAAELPYAVGKVGINYSDNGIKLSIKTKKGVDSDFLIPGSRSGVVVPLENELVVQAKLFKILLKSFSSKSSVKLTVSQKGLGVQCDEYSAAVYSEAK